MEQLELTPFERGMEGSATAARHKWTPEERRVVALAVEWCARNRDEFTSDEVWAALGGSVPVTKGLASILNMAARTGLIESTGTTRVCRRGGAHDHAQRLTVWRSLVR